MPDPPRKRWVLRDDEPPQDWAEVGRAQAIPPTVLSTLWGRGVNTADAVDRFLKPRLEDLHDPFSLPDADRAVDRVRRALGSGEEIFVFGDYDVDGITAAALWTRVLRGIGGRVHTMVPNRLQDGYGLSHRAIDEAVAVGARVLIANDCGTCQHEAIEYANARGLDVVVADHHMPDPTLPAAHALVNPKLPGSRYPFPDLCAVGVAFKLLQGVVERGGSADDRTLLLNHLDLVSLGCVADVVPLRDENRIFAHFGLRILRTRRRPALQALVETSGLTEKRLEASHLAFSLVPRLNAAGRLGRPELALSLLLADDLEEARQAAERLEAENDERRRLHEVVLEEAGRAVEAERDRWLEGAIVLGSADWHPGVLGIAAARLVERYGVPVILVSLEGDVARGSARTPAGVNLLDLVATAGEHLSTFGGHRQAVGLSLRPADFCGFQADLASRSKQVLKDGPVEATLNLDGVLEPSDCDVELARWIERLGPFGEGNPEPLYYGHAFCSRALVLKERHLRLSARARGRAIDCIGFGLAGHAEDIPAGGAELKLAFTPTLNRFRGQETVQLKLREIDFV